MTQTNKQNLTTPKVSTIRRRALDAARHMLEQQGPDALQLRAIADEIGCGAASLYYHFESKEQLLATIAVEGFQELNTELLKATSNRKFKRRIEASSFAYLRFMHRHLRLYALMHSPDVLAANPDVRKAEQATFNTFHATLVGDPHIPGNKVDNIALMIWALGRGIASMIMTKGDITREEAVRKAEAIVAGYQALRFPSNDDPADD